MIQWQTGADSASDAAIPTGRQRSVIVAAGGTGGHVFPGLALGLELRRLGFRIVWVGRDGSLEQQVAAENDFEFVTIAASGFFGKNPVQKLMAIVRLADSVLNVYGLVKRIQPVGVVATGCYAAAAVLVVAWLLRIPIFLLELNRIPGRVTRFFAGHAKRSFLAMPPEKGLAGESEVLGCPLRPEFTHARPCDDGHTILTIGGSLGARALNEAVVKCATKLRDFSFIIVTGRHDFERVQRMVEAIGSGNCQVVGFAPRPWELYQQATVAISRAGGAVLAELAAVGIPSLLVPLPSAVDGHQEANARFFELAGAAVVLPQERLSILQDELVRILSDRSRRMRMAVAAKSLAQPDAAKAIAQRIKQCLAA